MPLDPGPEGLSLEPLSVSQAAAGGEDALIAGP